MARILLHTLVFSPDGVSTAILVSELAQMLKDTHQHDITVLTTTPHYSRNEVAEADQPLSRCWGGLYYRSDYHGMSVIHVPMRRKSESGGRTRDYIAFHFWSLLLGMLLIGRQDIVLTPSPPLTIGVIGWILSRLKGARLIYNVQEVYPAYSIQSGTLRPGSFMHKVLLWVEQFVYNYAYSVTVITDYFRREIIKVAKNADKVVTIPNFSLIDFQHNEQQSPTLPDRLNYVDKFVVMYGGNIGTAHSIDTLVETMDLVRHDTHIQFLIAGDGVRYAFLEEDIARRQLDNVTLLGYVPIGEMASVYAVSDVGLVPLKKGTAKSALPSKVYTVMAAGLPVMAVVDPDSDTANLVEQAQCGQVVPPDDPESLAAALRAMATDEKALVRFRQNALSFIQAHYSREAVASMYHNLIKSVCDGSL